MKGFTKVGLSLAITAAAVWQLTACQTNNGPVKLLTNSPVKCGGVNACKGMSECKTHRNSCQGQNVCKGIGWISMSPLECAKSGGTHLDQ